MTVEQRQFYRLNLAGDAPVAVLDQGRDRVKCWIVEMSLGGFGVVAPTHLKATVDSLANLQFQDLQYVVRITRREPLGDCLLVGMELVEELVADTTVVRSTPFARWLTGFAWAAALATVAAACYVLFRSPDRLA